ncbi:MAG TPA: hypothetical protein VK509_19215 [Polyangiales bacterium]|nr:hypothetical protein [Polyangiales bacterium]
MVLRGSVEPAPATSAAEREVGERLAGPVFARFSSAWWKTHEWPDVLGCALRFSTRSELALAPSGHDQDLLLATIRHPLTTLLAPLSTHANDYLRNHYFGVSPFRVAPLGRVKLRLAPERPAPGGQGRDQRLDSALERGPIALTLEARCDQLAARYRPIARIELVARVEPEPLELRFDPFASGRGLEPCGFVHGLRVASYAASRYARGAT